MGFINRCIPIKILILIMFSDLNANQINEIACNQAISGNYHASYYLSNVFKKNNDTYFSDFWQLTAAIQGSPKANSELASKTLNPFLYIKVFQCSFDYRNCFSELITKQKKEEENFFEQYSKNKKFGWPDYKTAVQIYLSEKKLICLSEELKEIEGIKNFNLSTSKIERMVINAK